MRTVSTDPGLMTAEELLANSTGGRRRTLEKIIAQHESSSLYRNRLRWACFTSLRERVHWFISKGRLHISYDDFMTVVTLFVLFGDWMKVLWFPPSADDTFIVLLNISFFLFLAEIIMNCWAKSDFTKGIFHVKGYMFNFFFWLDLLCILSMVPDLKWMASLFGISDLSGTSVGAKVGKAGKIGAKTGRVIRMVRLIRLVKLYKIASQKKRERKIVEELTKLVEVGHIGQGDIVDYLDKNSSSQKQSKVGAELSDIITRRVIVAVLLMLLVVPMLSYSSSVQREEEATYFLQSINVNTGMGDISLCSNLIDAAKEYTDFMNNILGTSKEDHMYLVGLDVKPERCNINNLVNFRYEDLILRLRDEEIKEISSEVMINDIELSVHGTFNMKYLIENEALAGIYMTLFLVFMLVTLSAQFTGDAQKLVLAPIESMMEMINMVADDPLEDYNYTKYSRTGGYETRVVEVAIQKITTLLRVGFGVAGAEIISKNMSMEGEGSAIDPMIPGKRVYAIFGFCDIHAFDLCTEKLEDEIMTFLNTIARIVHDEVTRWGGLCNKNLGNAFLMVWRIGDESALQENTGRRRRKSQGGSLSVDLRRIAGLDMVADKALIGFLKVLIEINRDKQVLGYRGDKRLVSGGELFKLRMGFGLNAGWAIEGAVGSSQKVDATYLSPHVNMAARMEAASRQFNVPILMTEKFFELMSAEAQEHCRKIDVVTVKGSSIPMPVYTYDTLQDQIFPQLRTPKCSNLDLDEVLRTQANEYDASFWIQDEDLVQLRCLSTNEFKAVFSKGLEHYLAGNWLKARDYFQKANELMRESDMKFDGPSETLLNHMKSSEWKSPVDWKGCRPLTNK